MPGYAKGTAGYQRLTLAMLFAGFSTFSLLYSVQPLLPVFARQFGLPAEGASLAVSLATGPLAVGILFAGAVSDRIGRRQMMVAAMFLAGVSSLATAIVPDWTTLLVLRFATGVALSGVPAVAMAYVAEEVDAASVGSAMGLYIAGSAIGGMAGRLGVSLLADIADWRWALVIVGLAGVAMAEAFRRLAPESRGFSIRARQRGGGWQIARALFADRALPLLYAEAFLLMGVFVTLYNYAGFRLMAPPYRLGHAAVGAIFLLYLLGSVSSAWFGGLAGRLGRRQVFWMPVALLILGIVLTAAAPLWAVVGGIAAVTIGFFGAHSVASAWVGRRAGDHRGAGAALYLFFYYAGSSVLGSAGGIAWTRAGWPGVTVFCLALAGAALTIALMLRRVMPLEDSSQTSRF
ncbi:YNFM family putative membrane transporter [Sphingomonas sp. PvP055]|uniref:MFS transporter n=1 Tax=Sphingomonas sp. PvP055 TaxID=3156391 RepID=UPI003394070B